jgi:hypothetical protein
LRFSSEVEDDPLFKILSWRDNLKEPQIISPESYRVREVHSIVEDDSAEWGSDFQGILVDSDWLTLDFSEFVSGI